MQQKLEAEFAIARPAQALDGSWLKLCDLQVGAAWQ
jgi:hypothetical protein